ncbi:TatD family hydrolase [bacterium]|nr:TatD family hydrolase [bacterium]
MIDDFTFVDTHCHVDLYRDYDSVIEVAEREKVFTIAVTNTPSVFGKMQQLTESKQYVHAAVGMHPELVRERWNELNLLEELVSQTRFIGEVGLDYTDSDPMVRERQRKVFDAILDISSKVGGKIITVHSRRAAEDVVSAIGSNYNGRIILHWYSGSHRTLERAIGYGYYFSVNPAMLVSKAGRQIIKRIPLDRVLTESDGPFVKIGTSIATPSSMESTIENLASLIDKDKHEVQTKIFSNFMDCLS